VTIEGVFNYAKRYLKKTGAKSPDLFLQDPKDAKPEEPKPDPEMVKLQMQGAQQQQEMTGKHQLAQMQIAADRQKAAEDLAVERERMAWDHQFKTEQAERDFTLRQQQSDAEMALKERQMIMEANVKVQTAAITAEAPESTSINGPEFGGEPG
jgi:hypothetical protein